jgi:hypothetical protein
MDGCRYLKNKPLQKNSGIPTQITSLFISSPSQALLGKVIPMKLSFQFYFEAELLLFSFPNACLPCFQQARLSTKCVGEQAGNLNGGAFGNEGNNPKAVFVESDHQIG